MKTILKIYYVIKNQKHKIYFSNEFNLLIFEFYSNSKTYSKMRLLYYDQHESKGYLHNLFNYIIIDKFLCAKEIVSLYLDNMFVCKD